MPEISSALVTGEGDGLTVTQPTMLYALLSAQECRISDLIAFAKGIPLEWIEQMALALGSAIQSDSRATKRRGLRRRQLVVLTTLLSRITFEMERVPQNPDARI